MEARKVQSETNEERLEPFFYNYMKERIYLQVLGGYTIIDKPFPCRIASWLFFLLMQTLFLFTTSMSFVTMAISFEQKDVFGQALFTIGTLVGGMGVTLVRYLVAGKLNEALEILESGVYNYNELIDTEYLRIKRKRVQNIKYMLSLTTWLFSSCGFAYIVIFPILKPFLVNVDPDNSVINTFLPIPLYVPFDTSETYSYDLMFATNALTLICMYASFASHLQIYISLSILLMAEYEVLNFSLDNIEKRAYMELRKGCDGLKSGSYAQPDFDNTDFEQSLFLCLRRNIIHHQTILRLRNVMGTYLESTNTVGVLLFAILVSTSIVIVLEEPNKNIVLSLTLGGTAFGYMPMCWFGEEITRKSLETSWALYSTPWPSCSKRFKLLLHIAQSNTFRPLVLRATALNVNISLETFGELMSTGYKLLNIIR
nr:olfactory receptor 70 [Tropidothorax elegans]